MGWKHKKLCPFLLSRLIIRDIHEKETKENPPYAPTLYSGSSLCYPKKSTVSDLSATVDFNLIHPLDYPPYSLLIYLKLLSQIVILYFISFIIPLEYPSFDSLFIYFWILTYRPIGIYLFQFICLMI